MLPFQYEAKAKDAYAERDQRYPFQSSKGRKTLEINSVGIVLLKVVKVVCTKLARTSDFSSNGHCI